MADRFPSIEDIEEGHTESRSGAIGLDGGPPPTDEDFLARERAALGDDADLFATPDDQHIGAPQPATVEDADNDLLGGGALNPAPAGLPVSDFENAFPAIDTQNENVAPGGTITGSNIPFLPGVQQSYSSYQEPEEVPEPVRAWRERQNLAIQEREEALAAKKEATVKEAQEAIDDFYENYNNKKEKDIAKSRQEGEDFLSSREDTSSGGTSWERIAKLVDLSGKGMTGGANGTGKEKFRSLLLNLRKDENAPGATGY